MYFFTSFAEETEFNAHGVEGIGKEYTPSSLQNKVGNFFKIK